MTRKKKPTAKKSTSSNTIRLNKYIAHAGICSRREADMHISLGVVKVNNKVITALGYQVKEGDVVHFDGKQIIYYRNIKNITREKMMEKCKNCKCDAHCPEPCFECKCKKGDCKHCNKE